MRTQQSKKSPSSHTVTLVLVLLLGLIGGHRFYTGRIFSGLLYLFTWGLWGFGWIFDIYTIATEQYADGDGLVVTR